MWRAVETYRIGDWDCTIEAQYADDEPYGPIQGYRVRLRNPSTRQVLDATDRHGKIDKARHALLIALHNRRK